MTELKFGPYKAWREDWNTEKVFTRAKMTAAKNEKQREMERALHILGITRTLPNGDIHSMVIASVRYTEDGIFIVVR